MKNKLWLAIALLFTILCLVSCEYISDIVNVTFDLNGAGNTWTVGVKSGEKISEPAKPSRDGYVFEGWYLGEEKFDFSTPITKNIKLVAKWAPKSPIVTFDSNGGTEVASIQLDYGAKVNLPSNPTREGDYEFLGWTLNGENFNNEVAITNNITLRALWGTDLSTSGEYVATNSTKNIAYKSLDIAVETAEDGDLIKIYKSSTEREQHLNIDKSITLEGVINNGNRPIISMSNDVTEVQDRGINIDGNNIDVVIKNLAIDTRTNSYTPGGDFYPRGINISGNNANVLIDNCDVQSKYYALNLTSSCENSTITVQDSKLVGYGAINEWASSTVINVIGSELYGINKYTGSSSDFSTICVEADTTLDIIESSNNSVINITGSKIYAAQLESGCTQQHIGFNALNSTRNKVVISNDTKFYKGTTPEDKSDNITYNESELIWLDQGTYNTIFIGDNQINIPNVYNVKYSYGSNEFHTNFNFIIQDEWLWEDDIIELIEDIVLTEDLEVVPYQKNYILNLNGHSITGGKLIISHDLYCDTPNLDIFKSSDTNKTVNCTGTGPYHYEIN